MSPNLRSQRFIGGIEVKPGAVISHNPSFELRFMVRARCLSADPDQWVGEVVLDSAPLITTEPMSDYWEAAQAAQRKLVERFTELMQEEE